MKHNSKIEENLEKIDLNPLKTEKRRRTRNDFMNRNFLCGCGKSYLSYPALYTHLKQKHSGVQPKGTILPQVKFVSKAKNPKSTKSSNMKPEISNESYTANSSLQDEDEGLKDFLKFFERYSLLNQKDEKASEGEGQNKQMKLPCLLHFPKEIFKKEEDYLKIYTYLEEISNNQRVPLASNDKTTKKGLISQPINCNKIFALFLFEISRHLKVSCFKEIVFFICLFRKSLNLIGWKFVSNKNEDEKNEFCEVHNGESILESCNEFITSCLPDLLNDYDDLAFDFIGKQEDKIKNLVFFTQFFGNWMYCNNYTTLKLKMNYDEP